MEEAEIAKLIKEHAIMRQLIDEIVEADKSRPGDVDESHDCFLAWWASDRAREILGMDEVGYSETSLSDVAKEPPAS